MIYYFRGICYERSKQWPKAEVDMKTALDLFPDQPLVLNYLGYSWVDQGINLDEGMRMIQRAVEQRADDGYIVELARLGLLPHRQLRRGREDISNTRSSSSPRIRPSTIISATPTGRSAVVLEARFQWSHARDLKPEPEDLTKIEDKLKGGLPDEAAAAADAPKSRAAADHVA